MGDLLFAGGGFDRRLAPVGPQTWCFPTDDPCDHVRASPVVPLLELRCSKSLASRKIIANNGSTFAKRSSRPDKCALALLHGQSAASGVKFARTGFNSTYRAAASR